MARSINSYIGKKRTAEVKRRSRISNGVRRAKKK